MGEEEEETLRICYNHIGVHFSCYIARPHVNSSNNNYNNNDIHANNSNKSQPSSSSTHLHPQDTNGPLLVVSPGVWHHLVVSVDYTEHQPHKTGVKQGESGGGTNHNNKAGGDVATGDHPVQHATYSIRAALNGQW